MASGEAECGYDEPSSDEQYQAVARGSSNNGSDNGLQAEQNPFEMPWYFKMAYVTLYVAMVTVATVGNFCVIYVVLSTRSMRTVTHFFIINLSVSDTLLATFNALFMMVYLLESNWIFGEFYCRVAQFLAPLLISTSIFTYTAIAMDRYMAIVYLVRMKPTPTQVALTLVGIWLVSALIATPNLLFATLMYTEDSNRAVCILEWPDGLQSTSDKIYNLFLIGVNYILPLAAMTIAYVKVCMVLWGSHVIGEWNRQQEQSIKAKRKLVKMLIACVAIFASCWAPMHTYQITTYISDAPRCWKYINYLYVLIYFVAMSNTVWPPIIYCQLNARFMLGFTNILRRVFCKKAKATHTMNSNEGYSSMAPLRRVAMYRTMPMITTSSLNLNKNAHLDTALVSGKTQKRPISVAYDLKNNAIVSQLH